jgi:hypothetical protein
MSVTPLKEMQHLYAIDLGLDCTYQAVGRSSKPVARSQWLLQCQDHLSMEQLISSPWLK